jgi:hypothetical protein
MNVLLLASHAVAEYDDVRMFSDMGIDVFAPGGYADPAHPGEDIRPPLPNAPDHPEFRRLCDVQREKHGDVDAQWAIDWAKADVHPDILDWADAVIVHHFPERWLPGLLDRTNYGGRVIWRTCGQSSPELERFMATLRPLGLEIVRYSPAEERGYGQFYAGHDALIRFGKYPQDYGPWHGSDPVVGNVTQHMKQRGDACGYSFWMAATQGLPARPAGAGSEELPGGIGKLSYPDMLDYLRHIRVYLYTGTRYASYTLGLIEAMMTGVPMVSIGPRAFGSDLFEGHEIVHSPWDGSDDTPSNARKWLRWLLDRDDYAADHGARMRGTGVRLFGIDTIKAQWASFLGVPLPPEAARLRSGAA